MMRGWICAAALMLAACASAPQAQSEQAFAPALFVARDDDSVMYLYGTVHIRRPGGDWGAANAKAALAESQELWTEMDLGPQAQAQAQALVLELGLSAEPLSARLTPEEYAALEALAQQLGVPVRQLEPMKPWLAALTLSVLPMMQAGYDPNAGIDRAVDRAAPAHVRRRSFETAEQQIGFFANLSEQAQMQFLREAINEAEQGAAALEALSIAWERGDLETLERLVIEQFRAEAPEAYEVIFTRRNRDWLETLMAELAGEGVDFVAVGAGHMLGDDGLVALLRARGVEVERVR